MFDIFCVRVYNRGVLKKEKKGEKEKQVLRYKKKATIPWSKQHKELRSIVKGWKLDFRYCGREQDPFPNFHVLRLWLLREYEESVKASLQGRRSLYNAFRSLILLGLIYTIFPLVSASLDDLCYFTLSPFLPLSLLSLFLPLVYFTLIHEKPLSSRNYHLANIKLREWQHFSISRFFYTFLSTPFFWMINCRKNYLLC